MPVQRDIRILRIFTLMSVAAQPNFTVKAFDSPAGFDLDRIKYLSVKSNL